VRLRGLLPLATLWRQAAPCLQGSALWAMELQPPTPAFSLRLQQFQHRLAARFRGDRKRPDEDPCDFWRRRHRLAAEWLRREGFVMWAAFHARLYFRAAMRAALSVGTWVHAAHAWKDRHWQYATRDLTGLCGGTHRVGRPQRWENVIADFASSVGPQPWTDSTSAWARAQERPFLRWLGL
jgi:hypothetical protein